LGCFLADFKLSQSLALVPSAGKAGGVACLSGDGGGRSFTPKGRNLLGGSLATGEYVPVAVVMDAEEPANDSVGGLDLGLTCIDSGFGGDLRGFLLGSLGGLKPRSFIAAVINCSTSRRSVHVE